MVEEFDLATHAALSVGEKNPVIRCKYSLTRHFSYRSFARESNPQEINP
jgi:hypothetical protein